MNYTFCTLFNKDYLYKGLTLYYSLLSSCKDFVIWILCMDMLTYSVLSSLQLDKVKLIPIEKFKTDQLRAIEQQRSIAEFCWTCTSLLLQYVMSRSPEMSQVAYLDSDIYFFDCPEPIYNELREQSILIVNHRYPPKRKYQEKFSGKYNVGMVIFRNDSYGNEALKWWAEQCVTECNIVGGDQKYLDEFPVQFHGVVELCHKGGGLGPWNIENYQLTLRDRKVHVDDDPLIFYHFSSFKVTDQRIGNKRLYQATYKQNFTFTQKQRQLIYYPYIKSLKQVIQQVGIRRPDFHEGYLRITMQQLVETLLTGNLLIV